MAGFFDGFSTGTVSVDGRLVRMRRGGKGPPLVLLHGNPQTHAMWHAVAPALADRFDVICPDLRGYGGTWKPPVSDDHAPYSKREMAAEIVALMRLLGHERFCLAGHDRGGRVAHRLAIDHPHRVEKLAVLDIVPTLEHFERTDMAFAMGYYHWFWLAQPHPFPETLINAAPDAWFAAHTSREPKPPGFFNPDALADYMDAVRTPAMITGMCEDYRAAASIDLDHDRESRAEGRKFQCPLLVLWGNRGKIPQWYDPLSVWSDYAALAPVGGAVNSGHYLPEEAPGETLAQFDRFFR